ncbi:MAG TPA: Spy/CpxP family protein refolding chaperone [Syntrophorhabdaceae bacterium]|nr:Spy/CpxP family protein refolding chaperone [Syntrophorhabdaceae bacterium]
MTAFIPLLLLLLLFAPPLYGQNSYAEFERGLGLSHSQKTQVEGIKNRYIDEWRTLKQESIRKRLELQELSKNPAANPEKIGKLRNEIGEIEQSRDNLYKQYRGEVSRTLNKEQRERYNSFCDTQKKQKVRSFRPGRYGR